jgi:alpha-1,2-mannosyltransferase
VRREADRGRWAIIWGIAAVAAAITAYQLTRPGFLFGLTPDISAWIGASIRLVHGGIPYRDFDLVQPPGFPLLASPFAFLSEWIGTRDALAVLRLCTPLLAAASVLLVGRVVSHRGSLAVMVACSAMAFYPAELYALHSGLLESVVDCLCLAAVALVFEGDSLTGSPRRLVAGGIVFGIAGTVKAPAIVPVLVVAVLCIPEIRRRLLPFLTGVVIGFGVPTLPFFLLAPASFVRDVLSALSSAPGTHRVPVSARLTEITGVSFGGSAVPAIIASVVLIAGVLAAFVLPQRRVSRLEWFAIVATLLAVLVQFSPSYYFENYAAFVAPFLALLLGISLARLVGLRLPRIAPAIAASGFACVLVSQMFLIHATATSDIAGLVDAVIPAGACTLSDAPKELVTTDRFVATAPGCNNMIDPEGATLSYGYGSSGAEHLWMATVARSDYIVTSTPFAHWYIPPDAGLRAYVAANFRLVQRGGLLFYIRNGFPTGEATVTSDSRNSR